MVEPVPSKGGMELTCPSCGTQFSVPDGAIGPKGRKVKCSQCAHTWKQFPLDAPLQEEVMPAPPPLPARQSAPPPQPARGSMPPPPMEMPPGDADSTLTEFGTLAMGGNLPMEEDRTMAMSAPARGGGGSGFRGNDLIPASREPMRAQGQYDDFTRTANDLSGPDIDDLLGQDPEPIPDLFSRPDEPALPPRKRSILAFLGSLVLFLAMLAGAAGAAWHWRAEVVTAVPQTEGLYVALGIPLDIIGLGLTFTDVVPERVAQNGSDVLTVRGFVKNISDRDRQVPLLAVMLLDGTGGVIQRVPAEPQVSVLAAGDNTGFRIVVENPSAAAQSFKVEFIARPKTPGTDSATPTTRGSP